MSALLFSDKNRTNLILKIIKRKINLPTKKIIYLFFIREKLIYLLKTELKDHIDHSTDFQWHVKIGLEF